MVWYAQLKQVRFKNGEYYPVLINNTGKYPVLLPFLYLIVSLKGLAYNTRRNRLKAVEKLYNHFYSIELDLDELIIARNWKKIIYELDKFINLELKQDRFLTTRLIPALSPETINLYLQSIHDYFKWCLARYQAPDSEFNIESFICSYKVFIPTNKRTYKSLTPTQRERLIELIAINSPDNPFEEKNRLRNYLIIQILLNTGLRLGELLNLRTSDLLKMVEQYYLRIVNIDHKEEDSRKDQPRLKNRYSERFVGISKQLYDLLEYYIKEKRKPFKDRRKLKISHGFLFTSSLGKPIAKRTVADIFHKISQNIINKSEALKKLSPHDLRHTFADNFLEYLIEVEKKDMERAKDELRMICGWNESSVMPAYYASRYIARVANEHNIKRVNNTYKDF